jgi:DNA/RNA-binding domain of Phe-tRNA-synthetase-like protein/SAM-dependent methyltransferase
MDFGHAAQIWTDFPELAAGVVLADGITAEADVREPVARYWARAEKRLAGTSEAGLPEIQAWRRAFTRMGLKPTQYRCAAESLLRRFRADHALPPIHPLVDLCNAVSLAYAIPIAVFDIGQVSWPLEVRYADGTESYQAFSGQTEQPRPGEVIFADAAGHAHARRWSHRQSARSAVSPATTGVLIVAEAMHESAAADVADLMVTLTAEIQALWPGSPVAEQLSLARPRFAPPRAGYTFGDTDIAAQRLKVLSEVFGPSSRALLAEVTSAPPELAYDLGCGPGYTTALLSAQTGALRTIGLDESASHVDRARKSASGPVEFAQWDVRQVPFPAGPADLIYCRLLLAHLPDPVAAATAWASQLTAGGLLVVDEIEWIDVSNPVLRAHLDLVTALIATTGAVMCAGPLLAGLGQAAGLAPRLRRVTRLPVATARAATMFAMNLAAWGDKPVTLGLCSPSELSELKAGLAALRESDAAGEITWGLHQAAYARS